MSTQAVTYLTPEQYLEIELAADFRSEYLAGAMYALAGASYNHANIVMAVAAQIFPGLRGSDCAVVTTDMRLAVPRYNLITYPDVFVTCGPRQFFDNCRDILADATLIVEVLSPSTKNYDRGEKFLFYRALPSFREYLLFSQDEVRAEQHIRQADGSWLMREYTSITDEIELASIGCSLRLDVVYERVEFEGT
jgi:Uma2 family endonuclease